MALTGKLSVFWIAGGLLGGDQRFSGWEVQP